MTTDDDARDEDAAPPRVGPGSARPARSEGLVARRPEPSAGARGSDLGDEPGMSPPPAFAATGPRAGGARDSADIADLLRSLNDELREDEAPPSRATGGRGAREDVGHDEDGDGRREMPRFAPTGDGPMAGGWLTSPPVVALAIIAALGVGGGAIWWGGGDSSDSAAPPPSLVVANGGSGGYADSGPPPALISRSPDSAAVAPAASRPAVQTPTYQTPTPTAPPAAPTAPTSAAAPRLLTPGQTATVVRPAVEAPSAASATVVVPPMEDGGDVGPSSTPSPAVVRAPVQKSAVQQAPQAPAPAAPGSRTAAAAPPKAPAKTASSGGASAGRSDGGFAVQVGTFSVAANAESLVTRLERAGWRAYGLDWQDSRGRTWRVVRVGNYPDQAAAKRAADGLRDKLSLSGPIIDVR